MKIVKKKNVVFTLLMGAALTVSLAFAACAKEPHKHTPAQDDGDCTTAVLCTDCEEVVVEGKSAHTPAQDDGDCLTEVPCADCEEVAIAARTEHTDENVDGKCDACSHQEDYYYDERTETYTVFTANGLYAWAADVVSWAPKNLVLGKDIVMPTEMNIDRNEDGEADSNWSPVYTLKGTVDGNGYSITGLVLEDTYERIAFIEEVEETGVVKNLFLKDVKIVGEIVSGLVYENSGLIENCGVSGTVKNLNDGWVNGIAAVNLESGRVIACYNDAELFGQGGGIVGQNFGSVIACYNTGTVAQTDADIYGPSVGGIVGANFEGSIFGCYNMASASAVGTHPRVGGIVGYNASEASVEHCYWDTTDETLTKGNGSDENDQNTLRVAGEITWTVAMNAMNQALEGAGYDWRYALNEGEDAGVRPLILVKASV